MEVMEGFKQKSAVDIDCCVGAIDGILIWINKLSVKDVRYSSLAQLSFSVGGR